MSGRDTPPRRTAARIRPRRQSGFSLVEVLVAAVILLVVLLGIVPMVTRAMANNMGGADFTRVSNMAKSRAEELFERPFNHPDLAVGETAEYWDDGRREWLALTGDPPREAQWLRRTIIRQYGIADLADDARFNAALPADEPLAAVHLKEITVRVESVSPLTAIGVRRRLTVRLLKPF